MDEEGRRRAARALRILTNGKDAVEIAELAGIPDPATVREFLLALSWPRMKTREKLEDAIDGLERGDLVLYAYGDKVIDEGEQDPVVAAIKRSGLTPANQRRLEIAYLDMLDAQAERRSG